MKKQTNAYIAIYTHTRTYIYMYIKIYEKETCLPGTEVKSSRKPAMAVYWTKSTVENLAMERCLSSDAKDKIRTNNAIHFIFDLNTILSFFLFLFRRVLSHSDS